MPRRQAYETPSRSRQATETRTQILDAGVALLRNAPSGGWSEVTFRSIAGHLGISERTVYRYFPTKDELHRAVLLHAELRSGVAHEPVEVENLPQAVAATVRWLSGGAPVSDSPSPPFVDEDIRRRQALLDAVVGDSTGDAAASRLVAAAVLDTLWDARVYIPLATRWGLDAASAAGAVQWMVGLVVDAVLAGRLPDDLATGRRDPSPQT